MTAAVCAPIQSAKQRGMPTSIVARGSAPNIVLAVLHSKFLLVKLEAYCAIAYCIQSCDTEQHTIKSSHPKNAYKSDKNILQICSWFSMVWRLSCLLVTQLVHRKLRNVIPKSTILYLRTGRPRRRTRGSEILASRTSKGG
eukprot:1812825-Amphidinium_carterae.1